MPGSGISHEFSSISNRQVVPMVADENHGRHVTHSIEQASIGGCNAPSQPSELRFDLFSNRQTKYDGRPTRWPGTGRKGRMDSMRRTIPKLLAVLCAVALAGCVSSQRTRLPTVGYNRPDVERRSYEVHDPSPDHDAGPAIERPRGFDQQRAEPRRIMEQSVNQTSAGVQSGLRPSAAKYPNSVTE